MEWWLSRTVSRGGLLVLGFALQSCVSGAGQGLQPVASVAELESLCPVWQVISPEQQAELEQELAGLPPEALIRTLLLPSWFELRRETVICHRKTNSGFKTGESPPP